MVYCPECESDLDIEEDEVDEGEVVSCPECGTELRYERSYVGGVPAGPIEQWDYFNCSAACGRFQYRQRTRQLRRIISR